MPSGNAVIAANFTADPLVPALRFWSDALDLELGVSVAPYDQIFQQLIDSRSEVRRNRGGVNVVLLKIDRFIDGPQDRRRYIALVREFADALVTAATGSSLVIAVVCPPSPDIVRDAGLSALIREGEDLLRSAIGANRHIVFVRPGEVLEPLAAAPYYDNDTERLGDIPYTEHWFASLATVLARRVRMHRTPQHKVLVLDCDNTLWRGVVGEIGADRVQLDAALHELHHFVIEQHDAGMLICLCSKNNEADVEEVFRTRTDMPLRREHFIRTKINWEAKSTNLRALAHELNLGLDSFVFIDDSPYEIAEVRENVPEVLALLLPTEPGAIRAFLGNAWCFDRSVVTDADRTRAESYRGDLQRGAVQKRSGSVESFLRELQLQVDIQSPAMGDRARASQMTQRTNQFNVSTIRRSEAELAAALSSSELEARIVSVRDRFGDYGIVGLMLFHVADNEMVVDTFLLSCRVLGRRVEYHMVGALGAIAEQRGIARIAMPFVRSARNQPALTFLNSLRTTTEPVTADHRFVIDTALARSAPTLQVTEMARGPGEEQDVSAAPRSVNSKSNPLLVRIATGWASPESVLAASRELHRRRTPVTTGARVPPATEIERTIAQLWKQVLHLEQVGVTDNFFDLGGTSVTAVALFAQLRRRFDPMLAPTLLLEAGTIRALADRVERGVDAVAPLTTLLPIQPAGDKVPLFCLHAGVGTVMFYYPLAKALGTSQPLYAFQSQGMYDKQPAHASIPEMAQHYIAEMRTVQPHGPYQLAGFCLGAVIAFEMALQLTAAGEEIALLASFDGPAPWFKARGDAWSPAPKRGLARLLYRIKIELLNKRNRLLRTYMKRRGGPVPGLFRWMPGYIRLNNHMAKTSYVPSERVACDIHVYTVKDRYPQPALGWERYTDGTVDVQEIIGDLRAHRDIMDPPMVLDLARRVQSLLDREPLPTLTLATASSRVPQQV